MAPAPLIAQTVYAELLERCATSAFTEAFAEDGAFTPKTIKGHRYWYFQTGIGPKRTQRYVGAETPELSQRIARHRQTCDDERERRALVTALTGSFNLPRPVSEIGDLIAALAKAGVFRLRGVLVGTAAYQTYSAMLGVRLSGAALQTDDVDIAQFKNVSVAVDDVTPPILQTLRQVDTTFRALPNISDDRRVTSYMARGGLRLDFLTPNQGPETDQPQALPALQTDAQPLRFLDFLIRDPEPAVILHNAGVHVLVPAPARYGVHKLIVSRRRREGSAKRDKDLLQAEALLEVLIKKRPYELKAAWQEAYGRGEKWRRLLAEGLSQIGASTREMTLKAIAGDADRMH